MLGDFKQPDFHDGFGSIEPAAINNQILCSKQAWIEFVEAKRDFLEKGEDPRLSDAVRDEVAESWVRSRNAGIDPRKRTLYRPLENESFEKIRADNKQLIEVARPILNAIDMLDIANNFIFELIEETGVSLIYTGNLNLHEFVNPQGIYDESTLGTCAHGLCFRHKAPVHIIGPEHYNIALEHLNAIAAPIFDEKHRMVATLLLTQPLVEDPWLPEFSYHHTHVFGLVLNLASAIECKLQLKWSQAQLSAALAEARDAKGRTDIRQSGKTAQRKGRPVASSTIVGDEVTTTFDDILGESTEIKRTIVLAKRFAQTEESILLIGESGTGKECFAQAIHNSSKRRGSFMSINCAAIPPRLIESELFGYEPGSFTGAEKSGRPGKIELADEGTLFLDEIGDMALDLQAVLLRVLENKRVMRLGGKNYQQIDFRVIAATNQNLNEMVKEGTFREDLLFRLSVLTIELPPLHKRGEDKIMFAYHYLDECIRKNEGGPADFDDEVIEAFKEYGFPGNVRQVKNIVTSSFYSATGPVIRLSDLPEYVRPASHAGTVPHCAPARPSTFSLAEQEESLIRNAMAQTGGKVEQAAVLLGISKATLYRKLSKMDGLP